MTKPHTIIRPLYEFVDISLNRNDQEVINLLFVLSGLYSDILKTENILQFWAKLILDARGTSFQRGWLEESLLLNFRGIKERNCEIAYPKGSRPQGFYNLDN